MKRAVAIILLISVFLTSCSINKQQNNTPTLLESGEITNEVREQFFDFASQNRINAMPELSKGKLVYDDYYAVIYATYFLKDEITSHQWSDTRYGYAVPVKSVQKLLKEKFDFEVDCSKFGLPIDRSEFNGLIPLKGESGKDWPICEILQYSKQTTDEGILVSARLAEYNYQNFMYLEKPSGDKPNEYDGIREKVIAGNGDKSLIICYIDLEYLTDDNGKLIKFVSYKNQYVE